MHQNFIQASNYLVNIKYLDDPTTITDSPIKGYIYEF